MVDLFWDDVDLDEILRSQDDGFEHPEGEDPPR